MRKPKTPKPELVVRPWLVPRDAQKRTLRDLIANTVALAEQSRGWPDDNGHPGQKMTREFLSNRAEMVAALEKAINDGDAVGSAFLGFCFGAYMSEHAWPATIRGAENLEHFAKGPGARRYKKPRETAEAIIDKMRDEPRSEVVKEVIKRTGIGRTTAYDWYDAHEKKQSV